MSTRAAAWLRSPSTRKGLLVAAVVGGCFVWTMVIVGLSFAMVERGNRQWWVIPVFGLLMMVVTLVAARRVSTVPSAVDVPPPAAQPRAAVVVRRTLAEPLSPREVEVLWQLAGGR